MGFGKQDSEKEFICRQCAKFLDSEELINGKCPECMNDEDVFMNEIEDQDE